MDGSADLTLPATLPSTGETEESTAPAERNHFVPVDTPALLRVMPRVRNDSLILTTAITLEIVGAKLSNATENYNSKKRMQVYVAMDRLPVHADDALLSVGKKTFDEDASALEFKDTVQIRDILHVDLVNVADNESLAEAGILKLSRSD